jgi:hypothetical protein
MLTVRAQGSIRCQLEQRRNEVSQTAFWHFRVPASLTPFLVVDLDVNSGSEFSWPALASTRIETPMIGRHWLHKRLRLIPTFAFSAALRHRSSQKTVLILDGIDKLNLHIRSSFHNYLHSELDSNDWSTLAPFFMCEVRLPRYIPTEETCRSGRVLKPGVSRKVRDYCRLRASDRII